MFKLFFHRYYTGCWIVTISPIKNLRILKEKG